MNTDDFVWNIALSRAIMKGKLNFKLQGFDILRNLNNVTYQLNGQGRMESWRRSIPNYWMLHVQWRFNKNPKRGFNLYLYSMLIHSFPHYLQQESADCGPSCLRMIAKYF